MSDSSKRVKPTLESLLKNSQLQTGKKLINKILVKEQELVLFKQSAEFEERNRKKRTFKTHFLLQKAVYLPV